MGEIVRPLEALPMINEEREWLDMPAVGAEIPPPWSAKQASNRRRAARRRLLRLRLRRDYIKAFVVDGRDDEIEGWIVVVRSNGGRLPAGVVVDATLAADIERAALMPFREILRVQHQLLTLGSGSARSMGREAI